MSKVPVYTLLQAIRSTRLVFNASNSICFLCYCSSFFGM